MVNPGLTSALTVCWFKMRNPLFIHPNEERLLPKTTFFPTRITCTKKRLNFENNKGSPDKSFRQYENPFLLTIISWKNKIVQDIKSSPFNQIELYGPTWVVPSLLVYRRLQLWCDFYGSCTEIGMFASQYLNIFLGKKQ